MPERRIHLQPIGSTPNRWLPARCEKTGKRTFPRKRDAEAQLVEWAQQNQYEGYAYWCKGPANGGNGCGGWHISRADEPRR